MPELAERGIARTAAENSVKASSAENRSRQTRTGRILCSTDEPTAARTHNVETSCDIRLPGLVGQHEAAGEWSGHEAADANPARKDDCRNETGMICPKLAEMREGKALAERQRIEVTHRVANALQVLMIRIERQRRLQVDPALRDELGKLAASARASAQLHRYLLPPHEPIHVDFGDLLRKLATAIECTAGLRCEVDVVETLTVPGHVAADLAAAVNELAWNAHKHGYGGVEGGVIRIICRRHPDARLLVSVADRGRGLPAGFDPRASKGLGLMVVFATARQLGGEVQVTSDQGARFTLLLPISLAEEADCSTAPS